MVWPVVLLVVVAVIQTAVVLQARATVTEAARAAVRVQALRGSHAGEAEATARDVAQTSKVTDVTVTVSTTDSLVRVDVEGRAAALFGAVVAVRGHAVAVEEGT
nr:TadE/TadG family type IV pilus assembly protein [Cutibacterium acnes]